MKSTLTSLLVGLPGAFVALGAQPPRPATLRADVVIAVRGDSASVQAHFEFGGNPGAMTFELLQQPCASIMGAVRVQSRGSDVALARELTQPWLRLHDTSDVDPGRSALGYSVRYNVRLEAAEVNVPLLLPVAVLRGRRRGDPVAEVNVTAARNVRVIAPRLTRTSDTTWSARMVALPSMLRLGGLTPNTDCSGAIAGESGRFQLIFWSLVATLALWVPTYLWWANRQRQTA